jgi:hypothetical protein
VNPFEVPVPIYLAEAAAGTSPSPSPKRLHVRAQDAGKGKSQKGKQKWIISGFYCVRVALVHTGRYLAFLTSLRRTKCIGKLTVN